MSDPLDAVLAAVGYLLLIGAVLPTRTRRPHPREQEILTLLRQGQSNNEVARTLHVDRGAVRRLRNEHGISRPTTPARTLEQKWAANVREVNDGERVHLEWTGPRAVSAGTPVLRYQDQTYSVAGIAFSMRTGRAPVGQVRAECTFPGCVAPTHLSDEEERTRIREQLRRTLGRRELPDRCGKGHDQRQARRYGPNGDPYCKTCVTDRKRKQRAKDKEPGSP